MSQKLFFFTHTTQFYGPVYPVCFKLTNIHWVAHVRVSASCASYLCIAHSLEGQTACLVLYIIVVSLFGFVDKTKSWEMHFVILLMDCWHQTDHHFGWVVLCMLAHWQELLGHLIGKKPLLMVCFTVTHVHIVYESCNWWASSLVWFVVPINCDGGVITSMKLHWSSVRNKMHLSPHCWGRPENITIVL